MYPLGVGTFRVRHSRSSRTVLGTRRRYLPPVFTPPAGGGPTVVEADGASAGIADVSGIGAAIWVGVGASSGVASVSGDGNAIWAPVGASAGVDAASGDGAAVWLGVGSSDGAGAASGVGIAIWLGVGASGGTGAASGVSGAVWLVVGESSGSASVSGESEGSAVDDGDTAPVFRPPTSAIAADGYVKLDNRYAITPDARTMFPDAIGKANAYWNPSGFRPGKAFVLMAYSDVQAIKNLESHELSFHQVDEKQESKTYTIKALYWVSARKITPGALSDNSIFLIELADKRIFPWKWSSRKELYNFRTPAHSTARFIVESTRYSSGAIGSGTYTESPYTWREAIAAIWPSDMVGSCPPLPTGFTLDEGCEDIQMHGENPFEMLEGVFGILGLRLSYDAVDDTFKILMNGQEQPLPIGMPEYSYLFEKYVDSPDSVLGLPETIEVNFGIHNRQYGKERDSYVNNNWLSGDCIYQHRQSTGYGSHGTVHRIWVNKPAVVDGDGTPDTETTTFAEWVADKCIDDLSIETTHLRCGGLHAVKTDGKLKAVIIGNFGNGMTTEFARHAGDAKEWHGGGLMDQRAGDDVFRRPSFNNKGTAQYPRETQVVQIQFEEVDEGTFATPVDTSTGSLHHRVYRAWLATAGYGDDLDSDRQPCFVRFTDSMYDSLDDIGVRQGAVYIARRYGWFDAALSGSDESEALPLYLASQECPIEFVLLTSDPPDGDGFYTADLQVWHSGWTTIDSVKVLETNGGTLTSNTRYPAKFVRKQTGAALFVASENGSFSQDWGWFEGTAGASIVGAGAQTVSFVERWGGQTVASPVYVWTNPSLLRAPSGYSVWGIGKLSGSTWTIEIMRVQLQNARAWLDPTWGDTEYNAILGTVDGCALSARDTTISVMSAAVLPAIDEQIQFHDQSMISAVFWDGDKLYRTVETICLPLPKSDVDEEIFDTTTQTVVTSANIDADSLNFPKSTVRVFTTSATTQDEIPLYQCNAPSDTIDGGGAAPAYDP